MSQPQALISPYPRLEPRQANSTQSTLSSPPTSTNQPSTSLTQTASATATPTPSSSSQLPSSSPSPSPSTSSTASATATASSSTPIPTSSSSPAPTSTASNPQPSPTSTSASVQPTSSSSSTPDQPTSSPQSSPAPSPAPVPTSSSNLPSQSSSSPPSSIPNTSSASVAPPSPSSEPATSTFSSRPPASHQSSTQIIVVTSTNYVTSTDTVGGVHTLTSYVSVSSNAPATTISAPGGTIIAQLHNGDTHPPGFFDNRGAVIGTFLTIGLIVLGGSTAIIWRLARFRRARLRARQEKEAELNVNNFLASEEDGRVAMLPETDDFQTIPLNHEAQHPQLDPSQVGPSFYHQPAGDSTLGYLDDPSYLHMQEIHPVRFSNRTGRSSDLNTMNTEEWGRYVHNNFSNGGSRIFGDGNKPELVRVDEEVAAPEGPPIIISSAETSAGHLPSFHIPAADSPPEIHTVEQETFRMVSPPRFALEDQIAQADQRLEPTILPRFNPQRPRSRDQDELSSLRDEEDYSRRILRVSNPDHEESDDHHSVTQS